MTNTGWDEGGREVASNWFKFEKVGDFIKGTLLSKRFQKANTPGYQDQWVYEIKMSDGKVYNVGIATSKDGTIKRLNNCQIGEIVGIKFDKEGEAKKGRFPAKLLVVKTWDMDPGYSEMDGGSEVEETEVAPM